MRSPLRDIRASIHPKPDWETIDWKKVRRRVKGLQVRIAKAVREGRHGQVRSLQWLLTHSFYARLLAVRRVVTNKGRKTPGIDGVIWSTPKQRMDAVGTLRRGGYRPLPLRRVYIRKKSGKNRPLGIPTMRDRAMQALYAFALVPIAETTADPNSYGFRECRCCADAIQQCYICLAQKGSAQWILEADIKACFDQIDHGWLLSQIPIDRKVLKAWLEAGYVADGELYPTRAGTPQGGIISPVLANMTLDGLEPAIKATVARTSKVHVIRYADDFIVTADSREILQEQVLPVIEGFLRERGLILSGAKTRISRLTDGFDFLAQNIRKYGDKLLITPSKSAIKSVIHKCKKIMRAYRGKQTADMVRALNSVILGWTNYHRHVCSKATYSYIDGRIFESLCKWAKRRHRDKGRRWLHGHYFRTIGSRNWCFFAVGRPEGDGSRIVDLRLASMTKIKRHVKIKAAANPYDNEWQRYFSLRPANLLYT